MDPSPSQMSGRGRARGRARGTTPPVGQGQEQGMEVEGLGQQQQEIPGPGPQVFGVMYEQGEGNGNNGGSGNGSNGSGSEGRGSARGSPDNGGRGEARGSRSGNGGGEGAREFTMPDYVVSRPPNFNKQGTSGTQLTAVTNYYEFQKHPNFEMCLYTVKVEPLVEEDKKARKLVGTKREEIGGYLMSGFQLFTTRPIRAELLEFQTFLEDAPANIFTIKLEFVRNVGQNEGLVFQFYNILVRRMQKILRYELLGRHYFDPAQKEAFPAWRLELWPGFANSIRQQETSLMLNVESCWKVLQTESVLRKMTQIRQEQPNNYEQACNQSIVGMMVVTTYNNKAYKISRIDFNATPSSTFNKGGRQVSYNDYYRERYNRNITVGRQPMLVSEPSLRDIRRGQTGDIYLVPEFCFPCGLNDELRNNNRLMKDLARCLHMPPAERCQTIDRFIHRVHTNEEIRATLLRWGVRIRNEKVQVKARLLERVQIIFGQNRTFMTDDKADWTNAFRSYRMLEVNPLERWAIVVTARDGGGVQNLVGTMQRVAGAVGYQIGQPTKMQINDNRIDTYVNGINNVVNQLQGQIDMLFIILSSNSPDLYSAVKRRCSIDYGIPSQCFLAKNLNSRGLMSICTKMIIQMNAKQGGEPWGIQVPSKTMMVLGYDVHHAGPGGGGGMSVGAMTASMNASLGKSYSTVVRLPSREEVAPAVGAMFEKCLDAYLKKNGRLPDRIMMYRDGVGEGQLKDAYEQELEGFKTRVRAKYGNNPLPKLSYIVVNKRINTRFFEVTGRDFGNPRPGFVVDDVVTRPERYDFFLVSQTARQGCVSPTYYNVLFDESGLSPDNIQKFTWKLCHMYYNWSGTVAVPGPCQNAHKLAFLTGTALKRPASERLAHLLHYL